MRLLGHEAPPHAANREAGTRGRASEARRLRASPCTVSYADRAAPQAIGILRAEVPFGGGQKAQPLQRQLGKHIGDRARMSTDQRGEAPVATTGQRRPICSNTRSIKPSTLPASPNTMPD